MKPSLSLRVSQHLALTPQLQQSIRLLQLSTLELGQEVDQMLDDNPFLERSQDESPREDFGLPQADTRDHDDEREYEGAPSSIANSSLDTGAIASNDAEPLGLTADDSQNWDGDGTVEMRPDDSEWGMDAKAHTNNLGGEEDLDITELARQQESLQSFLHRQAMGMRMSAEEHAALRFLIESLTDDGYLEDSLEALAEGLVGPKDPKQVEQMLHHFTVALSLLQSLEPAGVGARNLAECLTLQLRGLLARAQSAIALVQSKPAATPQKPDRTLDAARARQSVEATRAEELTAKVRLIKISLRMCESSMELLARRDFKRLVVVCACTDADVREAIALIGQLEPKPGRRFVDVERNVVLPDVLVIKVGAGTQARFKVQLNADVMPRLRVHDIYANALRSHRGGGSDTGNHAMLQQRLQEARWFIKNIQQRFDTILRVSTAIVERQKSFFMHGELAMRPLVLREIADELGLHESTISRVTTAKFMATPFGTFELKYFFGSGLGTESGGNASSTAVRALIKQFVSAELPKKPLSDNQLSQMLKEQGIECARRTVAKYREALKIAPANLRKAL